jgi:hypothetical protein
MDKALDYLQKIQKTVLALSAEGITDPVELTKKAAAVLGLPPQAVTPLLARTFAANLQLRDQKNLLSDI